jgi:PIN domain nuclease of toxin-antitoxin system
MTEDPRLSRTAAQLLESESIEVTVSPVSAIEIAIKHRIGRLPHGDVLVPAFRKRVEADGFHLSTLSVEHALRAGSYPGAHRDPFDRLLAAQAELEGLTLVTRDPAFADFPCETLW